MSSYRGKPRTSRTLKSVKRVLPLFNEKPERVQTMEEINHSSSNDEKVSKRGLNVWF